MASLYPAQIDTVTTLPTVVDGLTPISGATINILRDTIIDIETALGINPQGIYTTVSARLDAIENGAGSSFIPGGDLSGSNVNQLVIGIYGRPISSVAPTTGQVLTWNGTVWAAVTGSSIPAGAAGGDLGSTYPNPSVVNINGASVPLAGSLTTGNTLQVSGSHSLTYAPINLAGGANYVSGTLPVGNLPSLAGDVSGSIAANTVGKLQGRSVANTAPTDGYALTWVAANNDWEPQPKIAIGVPNLATLRTTTGKLNTTAVMGGYYAVGDGGGGDFYWDTSSSSGDNGGTIIVPTGSSSGRWLRVYQDSISVKWFGAKGDNAHNDTSAIQSALTLANGNNIKVSVPNGTYLCTSTLELGTLTIFEGIGNATLSFNVIGNGIERVNPINGSFSDNTTVKGLTLVCTNGANVGGGIVNVDGAYFWVVECGVSGFNYGVVFDQTEISWIEKCSLNGLISGVWLVNGPGAPPYIPTTNVQFTNVISIADNQIAGGLAGIIDDGGYAHNIERNNFTAHSSGFPSWLANHNFALNTTITAGYNGLLFKATTVTGNSGIIQPVWPNSVGSTIGDGYITWTCERPSGACGIYIAGTEMCNINGNYFEEAVPCIISSNYNVWAQYITNGPSGGYVNIVVNVTNNFMEGPPCYLLANATQFLLTFSNNECFSGIAPFSIINSFGLGNLTFLNNYNGSYDGITQVGSLSFGDFAGTYGLGINTGSALNTSLDVNGGFALRAHQISVAGGADNANINIGNAFGVGVVTTTEIIGFGSGSGAFSVSGFANGADGILFDLYNFTGQQMTIKHEALSTSANQIECPNGSDIVIAPAPAGGFTLAKFRYSINKNKWLCVDVKSPNGLTAGVVNMAALRNTIPQLSNTSILLDGYYTLGDGGGGPFAWDSSSSTGDDGGTIVVPTGSSTGRWKRVYDPGFVSVKWFGAYGDNTHDDTAAIQNAINYGGTVSFPEATYLISVSSASGVALSINTTPTILQGSGRNTIIRVNGFAANATAGVGILFEPGNNGGNNIEGSQINNMQLNGGSPLPLDFVIVHTDYFSSSNVVVNSCRRFGMLIESGTTPGIIGTTLNANGTELFADTWRIDNLLAESCGFSGTGATGSVCTGVPSFTQPIIGGSVTLTVGNTAGIAKGMAAIINSASGFIYGLYNIVVNSLTSITLTFIDTGNNNPNGIGIGNIVPANTQIQQGAAIHCQGGDTNAGMANLAFPINCCFGIVDYSEGGNTFNKCYVTDSYCAYVLHSLGGGSTFFGCGVEGAGIPYVSCFSNSDLCIGGQLSSSAGQPGGFNTCETFGNFNAGFIAGRLDSIGGTEHTATIPSVGQSGGSGPIAFGRTPNSGTGSKYLFTHIGHTGSQTPYIDGSYLWQTTNTSSSYPIGYLNGPFGWTDIDNVRAGGNAAGCPFIAAPWMNTPQQWKFKQLVFLSGGNNIVYLNGGNIDAGGLPFANDGYGFWPNAENSCAIHLEFDNVTDMVSAGVTSVNGTTYIMHSLNNGNIAASINVANSCLTTIVWAFDLFIQNYISGSGSVG